MAKLLFGVGSKFKAQNSKPKAQGGAKRKLSLRNPDPSGSREARFGIQSLKTKAKPKPVSLNLLLPQIFESLNLREIMQSDVVFITNEQRLRPMDSEVFRLWGDNKTLKELTSWQPEYTIQQGLKKTVNWFLKSGILKKYKAGITNV